MPSLWTIMVYSTMTKNEFRPSPSQAGLVQIPDGCPITREPATNTRAVIEHFRKDPRTIGRQSTAAPHQDPRNYETRRNAAGGTQRCGQERRHFCRWRDVPATGLLLFPQPRPRGTHDLTAPGRLQSPKPRLPTDGNDDQRWSTKVRVLEHQARLPDRPSHRIPRPNRIPSTGRMTDCLQQELTCDLEHVYAKKEFHRLRHVKCDLVTRRHESGHPCHPRNDEKCSPKDVTSKFVNDPRETINIEHASRCRC